MIFKTVYSFVFLPLIIFIGLVTSYEDFKYSKIRNKWILLGLTYSLFIYALAWILYRLAIEGLTIGFIGGVSSYLVWLFDKWCINLIISTICSYSLWYFKKWAAGDAKLFICYSALIPMGQYSKVYFDYYFASFTLLLAIFIPAFAFLFLKSAFNFLKSFSFINLKSRILRFIKEDLAKKLSKLNEVSIYKTILGFFVFFLFFRILRQELYSFLKDFLPNQNIIILISLVAFRPLSRVFKNSSMILYIVVVVLIGYAAFSVGYSSDRFISMISSASGRTGLTLILFRLLRTVSRTNLGRKESSEKTTPFAHWMFLGVIITWFMQ